MEVYNVIAREWNEYKQKPLQLAEMLLHYGGGKVVLDAGTGNGRHLPLLVRRFEKIYAIDSSEKMLEIAHKNYAELGVNFKLADITLLPFSENFFDVVLCTAVLHHLTAEDAVVAFNELHRVLKPSGVVLASVWNKRQPRFEKIRDSEANVVWKLKSGETCRRFVHFFEKKDIEKLVSSAGFKVELIFHELNGREHEENGAENLCFVLRKIT